MLSGMGTHGPADIKQLFIQHLAERLEQMECAAVPMHPIAYRLYARRLREALAQHPGGRAGGALAQRYTAVSEVLASRHFDQHGFLPGGDAVHARAIAELALIRMKLPRR